MCPRSSSSLSSATFIAIKPVATARIAAAVNMSSVRNVVTRVQLRATCSLSRRRDREAARAIAAPATLARDHTTPDKQWRAAAPAPA